MSNESYCPSFDGQKVFLFTVMLRLVIHNAFYKSFYERKYRSRQQLCLSQTLSNFLQRKLSLKHFLSFYRVKKEMLIDDKLEILTTSAFNLPNCGSVCSYSF